jgi:hypothetical protein
VSAHGLKSRISIHGFCVSDIEMSRSMKNEYFRPRKLSSDSEESSSEEEAAIQDTFFKDLQNIKTEDEYFRRKKVMAVRDLSASSEEESESGGESESGDNSELNSGPESDEGANDASSDSSHQSARSSKSCSDSSHSVGSMPRSPPPTHSSNGAGTVSHSKWTPPRASTSRNRSNSMGSRSSNVSSITLDGALFEGDSVFADDTALSQQYLTPYETACRGCVPNGHGHVASSHDQAVNVPHLCGQAPTFTHVPRSKTSAVQPWRAITEALSVDLTVGANTARGGPPSAIFLLPPNQISFGSELNHKVPNKAPNQKPHTVPVPNKAPNQKPHTVPTGVSTVPVREQQRGSRPVAVAPPLPALALTPGAHSNPFLCHR